ncbi:MAG: ATP-binding cassette subfamily B multidrug efflux pump [Clostridium sp.]
MYKDWYDCSLMALSGVVMAVITGGRLALILVISVPIMMIMIAFIISKTTKYFESMQEKIDSINRVLRD